MSGIDRQRVLEAGERLASEAARLHAKGWMAATAGNLSEVLSHDPLLLAVTPSGLDKGALEPHHVVVVDAAGDAVDVAGIVTRRPSAEAGLHARVAAATGAGAVVHVHTHSAVRAARRWPGGPTLTGLEMLKALGRSDHDEVRIPVIANSQDMVELGDRFEAVCDANVPGVLVAGHGAYVWGDDLQAARWHAEAIDWLLTLELDDVS